MAETTSGKVYDNSSDYSSYLQELITKLNNTSSYTAKTDDEIKAQAESEYQSYYDQLRLAKQQEYETSDLALQQQKEALQATYDKQREASAKQYAQSYAQAGRNMLQKGMQRSSYGAATQANIALQGNEAQQDLYSEQGSKENDLEAQRTQLASQLATQIMEYDANQAADVLKRTNELKDTEYERTTADQQYRDTLSQNIYNLIYQAERDKVSDAQWQAEFDEKYGSSGSGSGGKKTTTTDSDTDVTEPSTGVNSMADFIAKYSQQAGVSSTKASSTKASFVVGKAASMQDYLTANAGKAMLEATTGNDYGAVVTHGVTNPLYKTSSFSKK